VFQILLLLLTGQDPALPVALEPAPPVVEAAVPAAPEAALPVRPVRPVSGYSEAGLAAGHTGTAVVEVDVQPDGTKGQVAIAVSSRSDLLDAEAISMITGATLRPQAVPTRYRIEVKFDPSNFLEMKCRDFALQSRWFAATWPEKSPTETTLYRASVGAMTLVAMNGGAAGVEALRPVREMEAQWPRLIVECEREPDRPYLQMLARLIG